MIHIAHKLRHVIAVAAFVVTAVQADAQSGVFNVQIGTPPAPPVALVRYNDQWNYHKGTNAPQSDWKVADDDALFPASEWPLGPGGFGYADGDDNTVLSDMLGLYSTVYIRKSFQVSTPF